VAPRDTIITSGDFYRRSRGGFGGPHAVPAPSVGSMGGGGGWAHGGGG
jgi:hypothetical protein